MRGEVVRNGGLLPVHGFVLAGGKSSRMGRDKVLAPWHGRTMIEIAVEKLRRVCTKVSISGNRKDLEWLAPVVAEVRRESGPAAGLEASLQSAGQGWAMFVPVDVPLVPAELLEHWAEAVLEREKDGLRLSYLRGHGDRQPTFCMLHSDCAAPLTEAIDRGILKLGLIFEAVAAQFGTGAVWMAEAETLLADEQAAGMPVEGWFSNVNTPEDLSALELWFRRVPRVQ